MEGDESCTEVVTVSCDLNRMVMDENTSIGRRASAVIATLLRPSARGRREQGSGVRRTIPSIAEARGWQRTRSIALAAAICAGCFVHASEPSDSGCGMPQCFSRSQADGGCGPLCQALDGGCGGLCVRALEGGACDYQEPIYCSNTEGGVGSPFCDTRSGFVWVEQQDVCCEAWIGGQRVSCI
jgi:hypothetical protein